MLRVRKTGIARSNRAQNKNSESTIYLYGPIGSWFGVDAQEMVKEINAVKADTLHLRIDSDGGDIFSARAIKTAIMQHPAKTIAHVDGLAASAASFIAMGADEVEVVEGGFLMIHNALSVLDILGYFNIDDIDELIEDLGKERSLHEKLNDSIAADYVKRSGNSLEKVKEWMDEETWFTAEEAVANKLADRVYDGKPVEGSYDLSVYAKAPEALKERNVGTTKREIEKALRDVGLSNKEAKALLSKGFEGLQRDADDTEEPVVEEPQRDVVDANLPNEQAEGDKADGVSSLMSHGQALLNRY